MSESIYKCDFSKLKFNLYKIMNLPKNCTQREVKKKYRKLVSKFHPDKNNSVEEDIFNHIVIAYQILSLTSKGLLGIILFSNVIFFGNWQCIIDEVKSKMPESYC